MAATMSYTEAQLGHSNPDPTIVNNDPGVAPSETDPGDNMSTTLTIRTGYSSGYHPGATGTLPLSRLSRHSVKIKACSSFPNLLSLYQTPIREESNLEKPKKKERRHRKERKKKVEQKQENEETHERRNTHEYRRIRIDTVAREQLDKFDNYVSTMTEKVDKQREDRRKYNEALQERLREQQELEKKKLRLHRGPKHVYVHDKSFLKTLPVSNYCKATRLADDLQKKGVLRTRGDVEKYWTGFADKTRGARDIFNDDTSSVNYPNQWMGVRNPEIKIECEEDDHLTDATSLKHDKQLPPLKKRHKKRARVVEDA